MDRFGLEVDSPEAMLWLSVLDKAIDDLTHDREEIVQDAERFLFNPEDNRLENLMSLLGGGVDGDHVKLVMRIKYGRL